MRDLLSWNVNLGRWAGVQVRLHALFLVLALLALVAAGRETRSDGLAHYGVFFAVLLGSVLLHELGHCLVARLLGGKVEQIVLWPLGGLVRPQMPPAPLRECAVALSGPAVNLFLAAVAAGILWLNNESVVTAANPLQPVFGVLNVSGAGQALEMVLWVNLWILLAVNLLPAAPMDGGAAVRSLLTYWLGTARAAQAAMRVSQLTGIGLCVAAWCIPVGTGTEYLWLPLLLLGVFLFCSARIAPLRPGRPVASDPAGYDLSQGDPARGGPAARESAVGEASMRSSYSLDTDSEEPEVRIPSGPAELRAIHREEQLQHQRKVEEAEDRRVDEILARLHQKGLDGLSTEDKALLDRVSARYRSRQRQHHS